MAATKKKKLKVHANEIDAGGGKTLEGALIDLAEQVKANDARCADRFARSEERSARVEERSARAEEMAAVALQTIASVSQDLRALTQELRAFAGRAEARLEALEKPAGA